MTTPDPTYVALMGQLLTASEGGASDAEISTLADELHAQYLGMLRGASTADGYPYPDPTDPLAEGADAIRALAEALAGRTIIEIKTAVLATALPQTYPAGWSYRLMNASEAGPGGWNRGTVASLLMTYRRPGDTATIQYQYRPLANPTFAYYRSGNSAGWGVWRNAAGPYGVANGTVTMPSAAASGGTSTASVTFPSGVFSAEPNVTMNSRTSVPAQRVTAAGSITATSFIATFHNMASSASGTNADWVAIQLDGPLVSGVTAAAAAADVGDGPVTVTVICPTAGCPNEGIPISAISEFVDDEGNTRTVDAFVCGGCGTELTPEATP